MREVPAEVRSGQKDEEAPRWQGHEGLGEEGFSELYVLECMMESLPIMLSIKSTWLTTAFGERGCSLGAVQRC